MMDEVLCNLAVSHLNDRCIFYHASLPNNENKCSWREHHYKSNVQCFPTVCLMSPRNANEADFLVHLSWPISFIGTVQITTDYFTQKYQDLDSIKYTQAITGLRCMHLA